jgi:hypothetical protein
MMSLVLMELVLGLVLADPAPAAPRPVAMILEVKGNVTAHTAQGTPRRATAMQVLGAGDRLLTKADGSMTLVFLKDHHQERLQPSTEATVSPDGCTAGPGVERLARPAPPRPVKDGLRNVTVNERGAAKIFRSDAPPAAVRPRVTPMSESKVVSDRPTFTWASTSGAQAYIVQVVIGGSNRPAWRQPIRTAATSLAYPKGEQPLPRGRKVQWTVLAETREGARRKVVEADLAIASEAEAKALADLKAQAQTAPPTELVLIALAYHNAGAFDEALTLFERLAQLAPEEPMFHAARAEYLEQAGKSEEANVAWKRARKLGYVAPGEKETQP